MAYYLLYLFLKLHYHHLKLYLNLLHKLLLEQSNLQSNFMYLLVIFNYYFVLLKLKSSNILHLVNLSLNCLILLLLLILILLFLTLTSKNLPMLLDYTQ